MNHRQKRRLWLGLGALTVVGVATGLVFYALGENINVYYTPSEIVRAHPLAHQTVRVGGLVLKGSVHTKPHGLTVSFMLSDLHATLPVTYTGLLPALFREGQGKIGRAHV